MNELKRCPFCGGTAEIVKVKSMNYSHLIIVRCTRCMASTKTFDDRKPEYAVEAWNVRAGS